MATLLDDTFVAILNGNFRTVMDTVKKEGWGLSAENCALLYGRFEVILNGDFGKVVKKVEKEGWGLKARNVDYLSIGMFEIF